MKLHKQTPNTREETEFKGGNKYFLMKRQNYLYIMREEKLILSRKIFGLIINLLIYYHVPFPTLSHLIRLRVTTKLNPKQDQ